MARGATIRALGFFCFLAALLLSMASVFLPWVSIPAVGQDRNGIEVLPIGPTLLISGAVLGTVVGRSRNLPFVATGSLIGLGVVGLLLAGSVWSEARGGNATYFDVNLASTRIDVRCGLWAFTAASVLLLAAGVFEAIRPENRRPR